MEKRRITTVANTIQARSRRWFIGSFHNKKRRQCRRAGETAAHKFECDKQSEKKANMILHRKLSKIVANHSKQCEMQKAITEHDEKERASSTRGPAYSGEKLSKTS